MQSSQENRPHRGIFHLLGQPQRVRMAGIDVLQFLNIHKFCLVGMQK